MKTSQLKLVAVTLLGLMILTNAVTASAQRPAKKPNILVIWGDDIGVHNISAYNNGISKFRTPNIDRIAREGMMFTHAYAQQSCTAGRASFILGQNPFRTGLLTIGLPGSPGGIPDWTPTIADLLKEQGYTTGQFGKNHLGDGNAKLPTVHGFDEFFGNLYHLNAEEEPEGYYYPKDPAFKAKLGPRGVLHCWATNKEDETVQPRWGKVGKQKIEDTGPLSTARMPTVDEEILQHTSAFIDRAHKNNKPFFVWFNSTRMHVWTHLKKESYGKTGIGIQADGMVEHDGMVGQLLKQLDDLGIANDTIVVYSTDNGAETFTWPDGGVTPFHGEKGTTYEGGFRVPMMVRWPGVIKPAQQTHELISQEDWMPTLAAAAGEPNVVEKLKTGYQANGRTWKIHPDGYNMLPLFKGEVTESPRVEIMYFDQAGNLNAVRWKEWKAHFAQTVGNIASGVRTQTSWPLLVNLHADPYEKMMFHADMGYLKWYAELIFLFAPIGEQVKKFMATVPDYPFEAPATMSAADINYRLLKAADALKRIKELETSAPPR